MNRQAMAVLGPLVFAALSTLAVAGRGSSPPGAAAQGSNPLIGTWRLVSAGSPGAVGLMMDHPVAISACPSCSRAARNTRVTNPLLRKRSRRSKASRPFLEHTLSRNQGRCRLISTGASIQTGRTRITRARYELSGSRLTLKQVPTLGGAGGTLVWERVPDSETLTATHRRLIGFWKLVPNEGEKVAAAAAGPDQRRGYIIYTASGNMAVHIMPAGRPRYAGAGPSGEEAKTALRGYTSYFGPYTVNEKDGYVVHQRIGHTIPASIGTNAQRFYEFKGNRLVLSFVSTTFTVPTTIQAAKARGT